MQLPAGYHSAKLVHSGRSLRIYSAVRNAEPHDVWCKLYLGESHEKSVARAKHELETLGRLEGVGLGKPIELIVGDEGPTLVLERPEGVLTPGISLLDWIEGGVPNTRAFLTVARALTAQLERIHAARVLLIDVCPTKIFVEPASATVHLIDVERARPLGATRDGAEDGSRSYALQSNLAYIAPEASGRMSRGIDQRSDLYSLGAVLYHALTGVPPFATDDPLTLIHSHIAKTPRPAVEVSNGIPPTLSRIVSKLLHKSPEDRYQTAYALSCDLEECQKQLAKTNSIPIDMPLGSADVPHRPLFSKALYGRDDDVRRLRDRYDRAVGGRSGLVVLSGPPGMGKSELINSLRAPAAETGGYVALGKFDQYRPDVPYAGFVQAFGALAQQILTESDARLRSWRDAFNDALGGIAGALVALAPDIGIILGPTPPVPALGPAQTRSRLALAVRQFLRAAATREHPLVLCLDDLQWADSASRELLRELLLLDESESLLVVGAYRDNEVSAGHPLELLLKELRELEVGIESIALDPLSAGACAQMLSAALGRPAGELTALASCVARKTGNLPLLIQQFIYYAYDLGLIQFEAGTGWVWDDVELAAAPIPDDAVAMMTAKLTVLPPATLAVIELASCAGSRFDVDILDGLSKRPRAEVESALFQLCDEGLIAPDASGFRFVHDRIREAAHALVSSEQRQELHRRMARLMLDRFALERLRDRVFEVADHLILAEPRLDGAERDVLVRVGAQAGKAALAAGAGETACHYLEAARRHFRPELWEQDPQLGFELFLHSAEAARQAKQFALAIELVEVLEARPLDRLPSAQVAAKRIGVRSVSLPPEETIDEILSVLRRFGIRWPSKPSVPRLAWEMLRTHLAMRGPLDASGFPDRKRPDAHEWIARMIVIGASGGAIAMSSGRLLGLLAAYMLRSYRHYGAGPGLSGILATWAAIRISRFMDAKDGQRCAQAALDWAERSGDPVSVAKTRYLVLAYVQPAIQSRRGVIRPLRETSERLFEVGDAEFAAYALILRAFHMSLIGEPIRDVLREFEALIARTRGGGSSVSIDGAWFGLLRLLHAPDGDLRDAAALGARARELTEEVRGRMGARFGVWSISAMVLCVLGRFEDVLDYTDPGSMGDDTSAQEGVFGADLLLYRGLAIGGNLVSTAPRMRRRTALRELRRCSRVLDGWVRLNSEFQAAAQALHAELEFARGRIDKGLALYARAAAAAGQLAYLNHAALFYERRAAMLTSLRRVTEAATELERAATWYEQWGAHAKANTLRGRAR